MTQTSKLVSETMAGVSELCDPNDTARQNPPSLRTLASYIRDPLGFPSDAELLQKTMPERAEWQEAKSGMRTTLRDFERAYREDERKLAEDVEREKAFYRAAAERANAVSREATMELLRPIISQAKPSVSEETRERMLALTRQELGRLIQEKQVELEKALTRIEALEERLVTLSEFVASQENNKHQDRVRKIYG